MTASAESEPRWRTWLLRVVTIGFLIQFTAVLGAYFAVHNYDIPNFVRVYGSPRVVGGWPSFLTVGAHSRHSSMPTALAEVEAEAMCGGTPIGVNLEPPSGPQGQWIARFVVPEQCDRVQWTIAGVVGGQRRSVEFEQRVSSQLAASEVFSSRIWAHREGRSTGQRATASMRLLPTSSACPIRVHVSSPVGHVSRFIGSDVFVRLVGPADVPVANGRIEVPRSTGGESSSVVTDALGVAVIRERFEDVATMSLQFDCEGESVTRHVEIVPGWEHERVVASPVVQGAAGDVTLLGEFARSGTSAMDAIMCDGVWVGTADHTSGQGREQQWSIRGTSLQTSRPVWCAIHRLAFWSQDPQRTTTHAWRRGSNAGDGPSLAGFVVQQRSRVPERLEPFFGAPTEALLSQADAETVRRFSGWLSGVAPRHFEPLIVLGDDLPQLQRELDETRTTGLRRLRWVLALEGLVLIVWTLAVLVPATFAQRRRFAEVLDEIDDELLVSPAAGAEMGGGWLPLVLSVVMIAMFLIGIAVLVQIMR